MRVRFRAVFAGRVQGVFFRAHAQRFASEFGIAGWVRNLPDGRVEALFEGEESAVEAVIALCQSRQPYAHVDSVELFREEVDQELNGFKVKY